MNHPLGSSVFSPVKWVGEESLEFNEINRVQLCASEWREAEKYRFTESECLEMGSGNLR